MEVDLSEMNVSTAAAPCQHRVLLVEDEGLIREILILAFEDAGFEVLEAGSADEAIAVLQDNEVAAVVTDVRMPGKRDGLGLAAWLAMTKPNLPVIITSGYVSKEQAKSLNPAIAAVVSKPYASEEVVRIVCDSLSATNSL